MNGGVDIEDMLKEAYLHLAIQLASIDSNSKYPDTIRNGTAPCRTCSRPSETPSFDHVVGMSSEKSSVKNSEASSIHINQEGNDSNSGSHGTSILVCEGNESNNGEHGTSNRVHKGDFSIMFLEFDGSFSRRKTKQYVSSKI